MFVADLSKLREILGLLAKDFKVLVPSKKGDQSGFVTLSDDTEIFLGENVYLSPKEVFFPQTEGMYWFKAVKNSVQIESAPEHQEKRILFGVRSCDMKSIRCLDEVFLTKGFVDNYYKIKRENTVIIALGCSQPGETCFCKGMGVDPQKAEGADVQAYLLGHQLGLEPVSEEGHKVINQIKSALRSEDVQIPACGEFSLKVNAEGVPEKLAKMFESSLWDEVARKCLNCGACTYICPTCHCFDISQDVRGENGVKYRCWDSCMFRDYTQMAGGHNPRPGKKEKVRNRFLHKLQFFQERYGMLLCTGCGRCINVCPVNLNITSVINSIKEAQIDV